MNKNRIILLISAIFLLYATAGICGEVVLTGRVIDINRDNGTILLAPVGKACPVRKKCCKRGCQAHRPFITDEIKVLSVPPRLRHRAKQGSFIKVWGRFKENNKYFIASKIKPFDPTGVRRRIGKGHGRRCRKREMMRRMEEDGP